MNFESVNFNINNSICNGFGGIVVIFTVLVNLKEKFTDVLIIYSVLML